MLEVVGDVVLHAEAPHDRTRARVLPGGERHELDEAELVECERRRGARGLGRDPVAALRGVMAQILARA